MPWGLNAWLLVGALLVTAASYFMGLSDGIDQEQGKQAIAQARLQSLIDAQNERAQVIATTYAESIQTSSDTALKLRRELDGTKKNLVTCDAGRAWLSAEFVRLHDAALQAVPNDTGKSTGEAAGAVAPEVLLDTEIENGKRWRNCRDQLNAIIDILEK